MIAYVFSQISQRNFINSVMALFKNGRASYDIREAEDQDEVVKKM